MLMLMAEEDSGCVAGVGCDQMSAWAPIPEAEEVQQNLDLAWRGMRREPLQERLGVQAPPLFADGCVPHAPVVAGRHDAQSQWPPADVACLEQQPSRSGVALSRQQRR